MVTTASPASPEPPKDPNDSMARQLGMFAVVIGGFFGHSVAGTLLGWLLWKYAGFPIWFIGVTALLGLWSGARTVMRIQKRNEKRNAT